MLAVVTRRFPDPVTETRTPCEQMALLHLRSISLRSLKSKVKNRNQISPPDSPIWKTPDELCPQWEGEAPPKRRSLGLVEGGLSGIVPAPPGELSGSPVGGQEVSAATSVWSWRNISPRPTLDCGRRHFCPVRKRPPPRLSHITPKPEDYGAFAKAS